MCYATAPVLSLKRARGSKSAHGRLALLSAELRGRERGEVRRQLVVRALRGAKIVIVAMARPSARLEPARASSGACVGCGRGSLLQLRLLLLLGLCSGERRCGLSVMAHIAALRALRCAREQSRKSSLRVFCERARCERELTRLARR